jgi:hypothetical protein
MIYEGLTEFAYGHNHFIISLLSFNRYVYIDTVSAIRFTSQVSPVCLRNVDQRRAVKRTRFLNIQ